MPPARAALFSRVCMRMNAQPQGTAASLGGYGSREPVGTVKWWWDLGWLAAKEMDTAEKSQLIEHLVKVRARARAAEGGRGRGKSESCGGQSRVAGVKESMRLPLHRSVREADELTRLVGAAIARDCVRVLWMRFVDRCCTAPSAACGVLAACVGAAKVG